MALRRIHSSKSLAPGTIELDPAEAHHIRNVLRLKSGDAVEAFDDSGNVANAVIQGCDADQVTMRVEQVHARKSGRQIIIASAIPKGERADWMIEKLSELGVSRFIPLETARSVVHPKGASKRERWMRIAMESAKQSRRAGVMEIGELTSLESAVRAMPRAASAGFYLSTNPAALPIATIGQSEFDIRHFLIGPEGGWTDDEIRLFESSHLTGVKLTGTILRVETAAVAAAAIVACMMEST